METLDSQYEASKAEKELYDFWLKLDVFKADPNSKKQKYCIILPPPNVTGVLHMGHALTCTLEDILIRRKRMQGFNALWLPGTDHAGIATQMVVEKKILKDEGKNKHDLGREEFLKRVWQWKEASQETILSQMRLIGCSVDWSRLSFTLDETPNLAVRTCFKKLHDDKLIYRQNAIIQWCPRCRTALSDLEVKFKELPGKFWHIKYKLKKDPSKYLVVATTRPETLLGDTAVAVHPEDARYAEFHGQQVILPLLNREIPVIQDSYVDKEFGTGALKITPGHDPNDYEVGLRHKLPIVTIFDEAAHLNSEAGPYKGLNREKGREKILEDLKSQDLLEKEVDHRHNVGHCDRCSTVVEPRVSSQWFVKADVLAKEAIRVVETKEIKIVPEEWEKTYFEWMRNIRPWCISRQLWWGHRIPAWHCKPCGHITVAVDTPVHCEQCKSTELTQDPDVLDTWFSSGLWPMSTLGWPKQTQDLKAFYPTDVLETGFDILFFWVARMIMLGIRMTGKIPFHTVYLHPMVRDEHGQKMSKTKGNVVDPLEIMGRTGTDALRFYLALNAFHGRDMRVSDEGVEGSRNFVNKLWNASRFVLMHFGESKTSNLDLKDEVNQWIWTRLTRTKEEVKAALDSYRFFDAAQALYHFVWDEYCFWFIEFIKSKEELEKRKASKETTAIEVLEETLRLLHPMIPFVTEKIWQVMPIRDTSAKSISLASYPEPKREQIFERAEGRIDRIRRLIETVRTTRGTHGLSPAIEISLSVGPMADAKILEEIKPFQELIKKLAKVHTLTFVTDEPPKETHLAHIQKDFKLYFVKTELGDIEREIERKKASLADKETALLRAKEKLNNEKFTSSAPEKVVAGVKKQHDDLLKEVTALKQYLKDLGG